MILCVARIDPLKGQDRLIQALPSVLEKIPNAKCVLVGDGSMTKEVLKADEKRRYEQRLRSLVSDLKLTGCVIFTGHVSRSDLMQAYEACDIVVLPSLMEGFGLAITEGMAFGKPVIGSATGGIMMQIWPGINGYLIEPGNVKQLSEALIKVLSNEHLKNRLGKRAKEIYEKYYSLERGVRDNIELYERILGL
jgi:glycosyltransferase involved in cell wall biosynthesis